MWQMIVTTIQMTFFRGPVTLVLLQCEICERTRKDILAIVVRYLRDTESPAALTAGVEENQ